MEDRSFSPPLIFETGQKAPELNHESSQRYLDDEMVTYEQYDEFYQQNDPNIFASRQFSYPSNSHTFLADRPQTENVIGRYDTNELFTFEEDELCTKAPIQERMQHSRWQVRKQLYVDIADSLRTGKFLMCIETESGVFEYFENFLKDMAWDSNITSQLEGLQTILVYVKLVPSIKNSLFFLADELIQKCALTKQKSGELVQQIVVELMGRDGEGLLLHYIIKRFTAKNPKEACFAIACVKNALPALPSTENVGKNLVSGLNKTLSHSTVEVRSSSMLLAFEIFIYIRDDIETFAKNLDLKSMQVKEFKENLENKGKISEKWSLFIKEKPKTEVSDLLILEESESVKKDLMALVPEGFFDIAYSNEIKVNREKLLKFIHSLEVPGLILEKKEYPNLVNAILHLIESNNTLIYTEAIKLLEILITKVPKSFTFKSKQYLQFLSDKFKEKKKNIISAIFNILHLFRLHEVCPFESIIEILLENSVHKVPQVREYSLTWIISEIQKLPSTIDLLEIQSTSFPYEKVLENLVILFGNKILNIASKDNMGSVRDAATKLLTLLKSLLQCSTNIDSLLAKLPKNKIINPERQNEVEVEHVAKETSPVPQDFFVEIPILHEKDQEIAVGVIEDIKKYCENVFRFEKIMTGIRNLDRESSLALKNPIVSTIVWVFFKFKIGNKAENIVCELNLLIEAVIREIGSFEDFLVPKIVKILLQFPIFIGKSNHKAIESTLDVFFMLSNQIQIISTAISFLSNIRLKKPRVTIEEKAIVSLKFTTNWLQKKLDKGFVKNHSEKCLGFIDILLDIRENDTVFSEHFIKELMISKTSLSGHLRKMLTVSGETSPLRSRSPNLSITEAPIEISVDDPSSLLREIKDLHNALKTGNSQQKLNSLNRLMTLVETVLSTPKQRRPFLNLSLEDLESLIKDIIFLCTKYKNYTNEPTLFEQLQQTTLQALTSLRVIISDKFAESSFKLLLFHLPVKNSNSQFVKNFNLNVYQLFSDWLSHLSTCEVISLVSETLEHDSVFNIHVVYIHILQWFLEVELKLGNFELEHLAPISIFLAGGLVGGPLSTSHPLSQGTRQLMVNYSEIFLEYLEEVFTEDSVESFFEEKLVNSGKLYVEFKNYKEKKIVTEEKCDTFRVSETSPEDKRNLMTKLSEITEQHEETRRNLLEVNKEYMTQVTLNYNLMQKLEEAKSKPAEKPKKTVQATQNESKRTPSFKPLTTFEEVLSCQNLFQDTPIAKKPSHISIFEPELLDQPIVPFYLQASEVYSFQHVLLSTKDPEEVKSHLIKVYSTLPDLHKIPFIQFLSKSLEQEDVLAAISTQILKGIISSILTFCVIEKRASNNPTRLLINALSKSEDNELTNALQQLLGIVMESKEVTTVVLVLVQCISESLPNSFYSEIPEDQKISLKLLLKCLVRVVSAVGNSAKTLRVFDVLLEMNKLFLSHPPEELHSDCKDVNDFEHMFKVMRAVSDAVVAIHPEKAEVFVKFSNNSSTNKSIFLKYLSAILVKKYNLSG